VLTAVWASTALLCQTFEQKRR